MCAPLPLDRYTLGTKDPGRSSMADRADAFSRSAAELGAVASYGLDAREMFRRAAAYAEKLLRVPSQGISQSNSRHALNWSST
jgi:hypothetical protein